MQQLRDVVVEGRVPIEEASAKRSPGRGLAAGAPEDIGPGLPPGLSARSQGV